MPIRVIVIIIIRYRPTDWERGEKTVEGGKPHISEPKQTLPTVLQSVIELLDDTTAIWFGPEVCR